FLFFLKGIHIARNIQIEIVFLDLFQCGEVGVFIDNYLALLAFQCDLPTFAVGVDDFLYVFMSQQVFVFSGFELTGGVDEEYAWFRVRCTRRSFWIPAFAGMTE